MDFLLKVGVSNLCVSLVLAAVAWSVHRSGKSPLLAHSLLVLVLAKLVTPPILEIPIVEISTQAEVNLSRKVSLADWNGASGFLFSITEESDGMSLATVSTGGPHWFLSLKPILIFCWIAGSTVVLIWSLNRIYRFHRLQKLASYETHPRWQRLAHELATRLQLQKTPVICVVAAEISPMVWWIGGKVRVLIPAELLSRLDDEDVRWILAHEFAHVKRRDHWIRWLEWSACVSFWWNPVAWWTRRHLRTNEEICCDGLVLSALKPSAEVYAGSLLAVVEFLAATAKRPPAFGSAIDGGGFLEQRFARIVSSDPLSEVSGRMHALILLAAIGVLPMGVAYANHSVNPVEQQAPQQMDGIENQPEFVSEIPPSASPGVEPNPMVTKPKSNHRRQPLDIEAAFKNIGVDRVMFDRIRGALQRSKISEDRMDAALIGMIRVIREKRSTGKFYEPSLRLNKYFERNRFPQEEITRIQRLSSRVFNSLERRKSQESSKHKRMTNR